MNHRTVILGVLLTAAALPGFVQAETNKNEPNDIETVHVVTPSRRVESLSETLASVSVLTRQDIERSAAEDLADLLRTVPGLDVVSSGGAGSQVSVFMRGGNSNHVLVLIDGVRASSSNTGAYVWEQLPVNQVERVEIVRGPRGSIYGSDSIGGVIHVITRGKPDPYARATAGSHGTAAFEGGLGYAGERTRISINAGYRDVDGFSAQNENGFSYDPDDDGFETLNLGIKGSTEVDAGKITYSLLLLDNESEFDQGVSETEQSIASLTWYGNISSNWHYQLLAGYADEELSSDFGFFETGFDSDRLQFSWQNQLDVGTRDTLGFGVDWYEENGKSLYSWDESRVNTGLYATWDHFRDRMHLQLSGRLDDNSEFGSEFTGQAAVAVPVGQSLELLASYGSAFRGPNLNEQYSPGFGGLFAGNPDLDPESSDSGEIGLRWNHAGGGELTASAYRTDVDDLIAFSGENFQAVNIDKARLEGLEFQYSLSRGNWRLDANLNLQDTEDRANGESLLRRADEKGTVSVERSFDNGSWLGLQWAYTGDRLDFGGIKLDSYQLINLRGGWQFRPDWRLELRGENLADEDYEPAYGFNAPDRSWFISLAWIP